MNIFRSCIICHNSLSCQVGTASEIMSAHIKRFHPEVYDEANKLAVLRQELRERFIDLTGVYTDSFFMLPRKK